ncbi:heterokaryon incompatibility protein-domain-containing protein [Scleroderma yunnanense]
MHLINVEAFLRREELIRERKQVDRRIRILEFRDDETTPYAILSHRWSEQEVHYDEMTELAKMKMDEQDEVRRRLGYQKILGCCKQAKGDGYGWLWIDTCCIDKRSSAELSEAINSMYRWYENSRVCYTYLHDVPGTAFPVESDKRTYPNSNGWPEWFSRGWTLQEMIAPNDVRFFNKDWHHIGDKKTLAAILSSITRVPQHVLTNGLSGNRPCVAQIMSWAAGRMTSRVEDRAYSLLGLLDVNMPMLYGEGKKAFHRLQLEIIRMSNDQSIFAWDSIGRNGWTGSILADDPSFFRHCDTMELMDPDEFIDSLKNHISEEALHSVEEDRFGIFPVTNRGIQIWMLLRPYVEFRSVFEAWLPCRYRPFSPPVSIKLASWKSNYYRYATSLWLKVSGDRTLQFRQLYLRYQDMLHHETTFEIDDSAITKNGITYCGTYPETRGNTVTLNATNPLCVKVYSDSQVNCHFAVGFGQCFGQDWIHFTYKKPSNIIFGKCSWEDYAKEEYNKMLARGPEHARSMAKARSRGERYDRVCIMQTHILGSTWTVQTSCFMWESSRKCGVRIEAFQCPVSCNVPDEWIGFNVEGTNGPNRDMRGLMIASGLNQYELLVDGVLMEFSLAPDGVKLGDYGHFTDSKDFHREGNIFSDFNFPVPVLEFTSNIQYNPTGFIENKGFLHKPLLSLSLPRNDYFNRLLTLFSTQLINRYLITRVIQYPKWDTNSFSTTEPLCTIEKPLVWHRNEHTDPPSVRESGRINGI